MWRHVPVVNLNVSKRVRRVRRALPPVLWDIIAGYITTEEAVMLRAVPMLQKSLEISATGCSALQLRLSAAEQKKQGAVPMGARQSLFIGPFLPRSIRCRQE